VKETFKLQEKNISDLSFIRIASFSLDIMLGDVWRNAEKIIKSAEKANRLNCNVVSFQPLTLTGSTCGSLFFDNFFLENAKKALFYIAEKTKQFSSILFIGLPIRNGGYLYNSVACINNGKVIFINALYNSSQTSHFFANYKGNCKKLEKDDILFGSDIHLNLVLPHGNSVTLKCMNEENGCAITTTAGIELFFSCLPTKAGNDKLKFYSSISKQRNNVILFSSPSITENDEHHVYSNLTAIFEKGEVLDSHSIFNDGFSYADVELLPSNMEENNLKENVSITLKDFASISELKRPISTLPFISFLHPSKEKIANYVSSLFCLQIEAINIRLESIGIKKVVLGVSGGLDSTMALLFCVASFKKHSMPVNDIHAITMPCFGTTEHTKSNAISLCEILHCNMEEISIKDAVLQHFNDIGQDERCFDVTFENAQARERTQVLMDKANKIGGIVIGSSDLSEIALGFSTYNGDHMAMYNINNSIPKTILRLCAEYAIENPKLFLEDERYQEKFKMLISSILETPISPELLPPTDGKISQKTEEILGSYNLQDFFIYHVCFNHYSPEKIIALTTKAFPKLSLEEISASLSSFYEKFIKSQFKRNCSPEGINSTGFSLSSWEMPSNVCGFSYFFDFG